jgi:hypothetical protein
MKFKQKISFYATILAFILYGGWCTKSLMFSFSKKKIIKLKELKNKSKRKEVTL